MYKDSLRKYLDDLASVQPAPGGGSGAALVAAAGVSLISMVANFTQGREKYKASEEQIKQLLAQAETIREKLIDLVDEDVAAYRKIASAYKLAKETTEQKRKRTEATQKALREALAPPLETCKLAHQAIKLCPLLVEKGNLNLISDVGVAVEFLQAAYNSALLNVDVNLNGIKDNQFIIEIREILEPLEEELNLIKQEVKQQVKAKIAG